MSSARSLEQLKSDLRAKHGYALVQAENLKGSIGLRTGWTELDSFTRGGFPCGELSLLESPEGLGPLTLWLEAAAHATRSGHRIAWLNSANDDREPFQLHPPAAHQRGVELQKMFLVDAPNAKKRGWILQEILASKLFSLVGCDLGEAHLPLREGRSLLLQARRSGAAVVLLSRRANAPVLRSLATLVLNFESPGVEVIRAARRPVPHTLSTTQRGDRHVDFITGPNTVGALDPCFILTGREDRGEDFGPRDI